MKGRGRSPRGGGVRVRQRPEEGGGSSPRAELFCAPQGPKRPSALGTGGTRVPPRKRGWGRYTAGGKHRDPRPTVHGPGERATGPQPRGGAGAPRKRGGRFWAAPAAARPPPPRKQCGASRRSAARGRTPDAGHPTPERGQPSERAAEWARGALAESHGRGAVPGRGAARPGGARGRGAGPGPPLAGTEGAGPGMRAPAAGSPSARRGAVPPSERARAGRRTAGGRGARRLPAPKM